ncbi:MAG: 50S ribosomal protein L9 [Fimbriimonadales bacterium]|nr:50S ribosomal protein L9 [Fimbriimonadales bacterium]
MKVILNQTLPKVGKEGQVVNVADGFARNFLFPRGIAVPATKGTLALLEKQNAKVAEELASTKAGAAGLAEKVDGQTIRLVGKTAKGSPKLFGAITSADIAAGIKESLGVEIDKKTVALLHPIKRIGVYEVLIDLHRDVDATIKLEIADEEGNLGIELPTERLPEMEEAESTSESTSETKQESEAISGENVE